MFGTNKLGNGVGNGALQSDGSLGGVMSPFLTSPDSFLSDSFPSPGDLFEQFIAARQLSAPCRHFCPGLGIGGNCTTAACSTGDGQEPDRVALWLLRTPSRRT